MSKLPIPPEMDDLPPSYSDSPPTYTSTLSTPPQPTSLSAVLNPLQMHLRDLPTRIKETNAITNSVQADKDLDVLSYILPHVESFLLSSDIAASRAGVAQLVVIPSSAALIPWALSEVDERRRAGEIIRVGRVDVLFPHGEKGGVKGGDSRVDGREVPKQGDREFGEFGDWGTWDDEGESGKDVGDTFWWRDEAMARRLAGYLQPKETVKTERREVQKTVEEKKGKGLFGWGRKNSEAKPPVTPASSSSNGPVGPALPEVEGVSMSVRAKTVTFRREDQYGVWESLSGMGIVITIRVRKV